MNIANTVASKLFVAFVAASMLLMLAAPAKAATAEELQAQIDALMAQISALTSSTDSGAGAAACAFTRSLTLGAQGADVNCLQNYLTSTGHYKFSGGSTSYFGPVTASAVAAWQGANGVTPAAGYFGPVSQAKYNMLVAAAPDTDDSDDDMDSDPDSDSGSDNNSNSGDLSGEADLNSFDVADGDDSDSVEEGSEGAEIAQFDVEFNDGDAMITRLDIALVGTGNTESDPWDIFGDISLVVDGDTLSTIDASDKDEYLDEDAGTLRFTGLDLVVSEDEEITISVVTDITSSVDNAGSATLADWDLTAEAVRYVDADDVTTTDTDTGDLDADTTDAAEFTIDTAGAGDELDLESSDEDPDATTFGLDEDTNTEEAIFAFDLSAEDSDGDVTLNEIVVGVVVSSSTVDTYVNDFRIEIDGESFDAETYANVGSTTLTFDVNGDFTISADEKVTVVLFADFENMDQPGNEGTTITATTTSAGIDAEGADDITVGGSPTVTGETHTLRVEGVDLALTDSSTASKANTDGTLTDDEGVYTLEFEVTAFGSDLYIDDSAASGTTMGTEGANFVITQNGSVITTGVRVATLDSDAELTGSRYKVSEGEAETFTLTVEFDPDATGSYKVQLYSVNFNDTNAAPDTQQTATPAEDFDTASLTI